MSEFSPMSELVATHPAFKELAKFVLDEHMKRRPEIDKKMNPLRYAAWKMYDDNLPEGHMRKGIMPMYLLVNGSVIDF